MPQLHICHWTQEYGKAEGSSFGLVLVSTEIPSRFLCDLLGWQVKAVLVGNAVLELGEPASWCPQNFSAITAESNKQAKAPCRCYVQVLSRNKTSPVLQLCRNACQFQMSQVHKDFKCLQDFKCLPLAGIPYHALNTEHPLHAARATPAQLTSILTPAA